MANRGTCRHCARSYVSVLDKELNIYKNASGKWCSVCSGCNSEQAYARKDHAKQSALRDWQCKKCAVFAKKFNGNQRVGRMRSLYNKFQKGAADRQISWNLSVEEFSGCYNGYCAMTGWPISVDYGRVTASLDRIDNSLGYYAANVQWVHVMVNMTKNKYDNKDFIEMCKAIAKMHE
jgi:hypothetical protein